MKAVTLLVACVLVGATAARPTAAMPAEDPKQVVDKGLVWLAGQQVEDGGWAGGGGIYPVTTTALAGIALLMEGSTTTHGTYAPHLRKAVRWFEKTAQPSGLLIPAEGNQEQGRPMISHGYAMIFLACACGEEDDGPRREMLTGLLRKAVAYAVAAQTSRGGWGVTPAVEGNGADEGHSTGVVLQGLLASRTVGIEVPRAAIEKAGKYFDASTIPDGGVAASLSVVGQAAGEPVVTAEAAVCALRCRPRSDRLARWVAFTARNRAPDVTRNDGFYNVMLRHCNLARVIYTLGEEGHRAIDPAAKDVVRWQDYRSALHRSLKNAQLEDGGWPDSSIGPQYFGALALIALQLDNGYLPFFSR